MQLKCRHDVPIVLTSASDSPLHIKLGLGEVPSVFKGKVQEFNYYRINAVSVRLIPKANSFGQTFASTKEPQKQLPVSVRNVVALWEPNPNNLWTHEGVFNHPRGKHWPGFRGKSLYTRIRTPIIVTMGANTGVDLKLRQRPMVSTGDIDVPWGRLVVATSKDIDNVDNIDPLYHAMFTYYVTVVGMSTY